MGNVVLLLLIFSLFTHNLLTSVRYVDVIGVTDIIVEVAFDYIGCNCLRVLPQGQTRAGVPRFLAIFARHQLAS